VAVPAADGVHVPLQRHDVVMATIRIREVPETAYETLRLRARLEGQSIQAYVRDRVVEMAGSPTKTEHAETIERALAQWGPVDVSAEQIVADVPDGRR